MEQNNIFTQNKQHTWNKNKQKQDIAMDRDQTFIAESNWRNSDNLCKWKEIILAAYRTRWAIAYSVEYWVPNFTERSAEMIAEILFKT